MVKYVTMTARLAAILTLWLLASAGFAETFAVTKEADDDGSCAPDDCALREAVLAANALPGADVIVVPGGSYQLSLTGSVPENASLTGDLDITDDLELRGDPTSPVTPNGRGGIYAIVDGVSDFVEFVNTTVSGNTAAVGGGIYIVGSANYNLINMTIANNEGDVPFSDGLVGDETNRLTFINTLFANNECGYIAALARSNGHNIEGPTSSCFDEFDPNPGNIDGLGTRA